MARITAIFVAVVLRREWVNLDLCLRATSSPPCGHGGLSEQDGHAAKGIASLSTGSYEGEIVFIGHLRGGGGVYPRLQRADYSVLGLFLFVS